MNDPTPASRRLSVLQRAASGRLEGVWDRPGVERGAERPALVLAAIFLTVYVAQLVHPGFGDQALSVRALAEGRWHVLVAHMFAHAGRSHLLLNVLALLALGPVVMTVLGAGPGAWGRFLGLFLGAGLAGGLAFLVLHPGGATPMVGSSGAIFGLWGVAARVRPGHAGVAPLASKRVAVRAAPALLANLIMLAVLLVASRLAGSQVGLAWEAHLGGFLFGLLVAPLLVRGRAVAPSTAG